MSEPIVLLVTGPPCSGKSSIARSLAARLVLPYLNKDAIKVSLYKSLDWRNPAMARGANEATYPLLFLFAEALLQAGQSFIMESNFRPAAMNARIRGLLARHGARALQIHCSAPVPVLMGRFRVRWTKGHRHPGHADNVHAPAIEANLRRGVYGALNLEGPLLALDTGDLDAVPLDEIEAWVRSKEQRVRSTHGI